ncbi:MAG: hypothetical protein FRX48_06250 [Lasallia pustulata]|uniref:Uncharacterized protein n=1 Tax=Lasallia pustulata TaxID=136370 RepID=A0A5M8PL82_9LECA|nr:MAG: hypothetical protein FRX48_06250 [Lasallia pustulata]
MAKQRKVTINTEITEDDLRVRELKAFIEQKLKDADDIKAFLQDFRESTEPGMIAASSVKSIEEALALTGVRYMGSMPAHVWHLPKDFDRTAEPQHACPWLETALSDFASSSYWHSHSAEALRRTPLDMIFFDRLSLRQNNAAARNLVLKGEHSIVTDCLGDQPHISGIADYVLGYCYAEAKRPETLSQGISQMILYLAGIQQHRKKLRPDKIMNTVYGTLTDSQKFEFFRLDDDGSLQISSQLKTYRFLDNILEAAMEFSPHTTPSKTFPASSAKWERQTGQKWFDILDTLAWESDTSNGEDEYDILKSGDRVTV